MSDGMDDMKTDYYALHRIKQKIAVCSICGDIKFKHELVTIGNINMCKEKCVYELKAVITNE